MANCLYLVFIISAGAFAAVPGRTITDPQFNSRIIGGKDAPEGAFPYQISIRYRDYHSCGGAIIHPEWVITAATCVLGRNEGSLSVSVGTNNLAVGGTIRTVLAMYTHENYDSKTEQNNVAILRVQRIDFTNRVGSIVLETGDVGGNKDVTASGWGSTTSSYPPVYADKLQYINLKTTTVESCANAHEYYPITASQICTLTRSGEGSCAGDSGGPLVTTVNGTPKLVGILNWMTAPCAVNKPDVYSRASAYYDWFKKKCNCI